jgi:MiaB/RimO family radical SAM methylthiotransferase
MTGCLSERYQNELPEGMPEVDIWTGVGDYHKIDEIVNQKKNLFSAKSYLIQNEDRVITGSISHSYIKIGEGCNQKCSFCAIPNFKGKLQSRPLDFIIDEIKKLSKRGFYDFSFISQDSSSYLRDFNQKDGLVNLINEVEKLDEVKSARILYLYPSTTSTKLIQKISDSKKFHNYFDIPIQHISDKMLKIMKRGFGKDKTVELLKSMKKVPNSFIRTSFIIGHPEETQEDFQEIIDFIQTFRFDMINIFAYSNEENTPAYKYENQISADEIDKRVSILENIIETQRIENLEKMVGSEIQIILNGESDEHEFLLSAKAINWGEEIDGEILINDKEIEKLEFGQTYFCKITEIAGDKLLGTILLR